MTHPDTPFFAVTTFTNVFDTEPVRDQVSLRQLVTGLFRFEVKVRSYRKQLRLNALIDQGAEALRMGHTPAGRLGKHLVEHMAAATDRGEDLDAAIAYAVDKERKHVRDEEKRTLPIWSAAHYSPGARRGTDGVVHLSCLVVDYDGTVTATEADDHWKDWFHVVHSTWSHTRDRPRFRVVLPLAGPVAGDHWDTVFQWAWRQTRGTIDPACKGRANTFALPCLPLADTPRIARVRRGGLLSPQTLGVPRAPAEPAPAAPDQTPFRGGDPDSRFVQVPVPEAELDTEPWDVESAFDDLF